jgi:F-type H+-transporting ATPase subunit delta
MAISSPVSRRYAKALIEVADKQRAVERTAEELDQVAEVIQGSPELRSVLLNPVFTPAEKSKVLGAVLSRLTVSELIQRFLQLVLDEDRLAELPAINRAVRRMADLRAGRVRAEVQSASPLSSDAQDSLRRALERKTGKTVEMEVTVDPSLLGGVRARIGSTVIDGTLRSQLEQLKEGLLRAD